MFLSAVGQISSLCQVFEHYGGHNNLIHAIAIAIYILYIMGAAGQSFSLSRRFEFIEYSHIAI